MLCWLRMQRLTRNFKLQVVPNCNSRSGLGETADGGLYDIFRREFGAPGTPRFEAARQNFIVAEAGYVSHPPQQAIT